VIFLEHGIEHRLGQQFLQLRVFVLQRLQSLAIGHFQPAVLDLPFVEGVTLPELRIPRPDAPPNEIGIAQNDPQDLV
jgi:hypothetical protein